MNGHLSSKIHVAPILIGLGALIIGILVYLIDRPSGHTYFLNRLPFPIPFDFNAPGILGRAGSVLPDFIHVFSFSLITAGILGSEKKGAFYSCLFWFVVNALFETGQKFGRTISPFVPRWFDGIPYIENTKNYFTRGTFDWLDLLAMLAGALSAWGLLLVLRYLFEKKRG